MCAQPPVFVSTTPDKTNQVATGPMFSSFEPKTTACFRESTAPNESYKVETEVEIQRRQKLDVYNGLFS